MKNTYTIQFEYNGIPHTYIDKSDMDYSPTKDWSDAAYNLVESIIERENLYVEGVVARKIRLFGKDQILIWTSGD